MNKNKAIQPDLNHAKALLLQIKISFLNGLPETCEQLELLVLSLADKKNAQQDYNEIYRKIHSLKGSAGTHGIMQISAICHQFEDYLNILNGEFGKINHHFIDACLAYVDLIKKASFEATKEKPEEEEIKNELAQLKKRLLNNHFSALIIDTSTLMVNICQNTLSNLSIQTVTIDDGLRALSRLLQEHFDFIITGNALKSLNSIAMISALKKSKSLNSNIKIIMLTSNAKVTIPEDCSPDYLIYRDSHLMTKLNSAIEEIISHKK